MESILDITTVRHRQLYKVAAVSCPTLIVNVYICPFLGNGACRILWNDCYFLLGLFFARMLWKSGTSPLVNEQGVIYWILCVFCVCAHIHTILIYQKTTMLPFMITLHHALWTFMVQEDMVGTDDHVGEHMVVLDVWLLCIFAHGCRQKG